MIRVGASSSKFVVCLVSLVGVLVARPAVADITIVKSDQWEVYTSGRVDGFFTYGQGDANPIPLQMGESIPPGAGLDVGSNAMPKFNAGGMNVQGTFQSMRLMSGFIPNVFGFGFKRRITDETALKVYVSLWATVQSDGQRKTNPVTTDAREGYLEVKGPWGSVVAGRALDLFSRGATENNFLYGFGYGVGMGDVDGIGTASGLIGFGVMASFFSPGLVYATPVLGGLQLSAGIYDPTPLQGTYEATRWARPEGEFTYDIRGVSFKLHLFANGEYQKVYRPGSNASATSWGVGYGGRVEIGPVHIGLAGNYGPGLGLAYALEPGSISVSQNYTLRTFDGYSALFQFSQPKFDINLGVGMSRSFELQEDIDMNYSVLTRQIAYSAAFVWHFTDYLHYDIDVLHGDAAWYLGEKQQFTFASTGLTATW